MDTGKLIASLDGPQGARIIKLVMFMTSEEGKRRLNNLPTKGLGWTTDKAGSYYLIAFPSLSGGLDIRIAQESASLMWGYSLKIYYSTPHEEQHFYVIASSGDRPANRAPGIYLVKLEESKQFADVSEIDLLLFSLYSAALMMVEAVS